MVADTLARRRRFAGAAPQDVPAAIVRAAEAAGGCGAALYVADLDGVEVRRAAGAPGWPERVRVRGAVGPELPLDAVAGVERALTSAAGGDAWAVPLVHGGRAPAVLVWEAPPAGDVAALAQDAAEALAAADARSDVLARARRARATSAAAEIQANLLPPNLARTAGGGEIAAAIIPAYGFGGDWYDHAENAEGVWLAVADATGTGVPAAAPSLLALGALRAARRAGASLEHAALRMDEAVKALGDPGRFVTAVLGVWSPATRRLRWLRFGHPLPVHITAQGRTVPVGAGAGHVPLGLLPGDEPLVCETLELAPGDRLLLTSDGVWERQAEWGERLHLAGILAALGAASETGAAATVSAVTSFVRRAASAPPDDDATVLCFAPGPREEDAA